VKDCPSVHTIADLATAGGTHVDLSFIEGRPSLLSSTSRDLEIHQERPNTQEAWVAWRKACSLWCNVRTGALHQSLGPCFQVPPYEEPGRTTGTHGMRDSWSGPVMATHPIDLSLGVEPASTSIDFQTESSLLSLLPAFRPKR
jgi:hypothetical protein